MTKQLRDLPTELEEKINAELESASAARAAGNEGKVRVSARRAVGWAVIAYYQQNGNELPSSSALDAIRAMINDEDIAREIRNSLPHFVRRLEKDSPDGESYWPLNLDLIEEAREVIRLLYR